MQPIMLVLTAGLVIHAMVVKPDDQPLVSPDVMMFVVLLPKLFVLGMFTAMVRRLRQLFNIDHDAAALDALAATHRLYRAAVGLLFIVDLACGLLILLQHVSGRLVLINDVVVVSIPLLMLAWGRWCTSPVDLLATRSFNSRYNLPPGWGAQSHSRLRYLTRWLVESVTPVLLPALLILAWWEVSERWGSGWSVTLPLFGETEGRDLLHLVGPFSLLVIWPFVLRVAWDMTPMPEGILRDQLVGVLKRAHARASQLLLWRTGGRLNFAAVLGGLPGGRFVIVSDGLVCRMSPAHLQAVIAHESAHLHYRHFLRMLLCAAGLISVMLLVWQFVVEPMLLAAGITGVVGDQVMATGILGLTWYFLYGWIMRRFERQADTFAAIQLSRPSLAAEAADWEKVESESSASTASEAVVITPEGAGQMCDTLSAVATLNGVNPAKHTWRHGSILWRQAHLQTLIGQRSDRLTVDRLLRAIQLASVVAVLVAIVVYGLFDAPMPI